MKRLTRAAAVVAVSLLAAAAAPAGADEPQTYRGTVYAVQLGGLDLLTGVGYALRVVHILTPETSVVRRGGSMLVSDVITGVIIQYDTHLHDDVLHTHTFTQQGNRIYDRHE